MTHIQEHVEEAQKLQAEALVDLFEIHMKGEIPSVVRINNVRNITWQGNLYEGLACQLTGTARSSDDEVNRPMLTIMNPDGIFKPYVAQGVLDGATVYRKRLLRSMLEADVNMCETNVWFVGRIAVLTSQTIGLELRNLSDGPNSTIPARMFYPPEYPVVSLT